VNLAHCEIFVETTIDSTLHAIDFMKMILLILKVFPTAIEFHVGITIPECIRMGGRNGQL